MNTPLNRWITVGLLLAVVSVGSLGRAQPAAMPADAPSAAASSSETADPAPTPSTVPPVASVAPSEDQPAPSGAPAVDGASGVTEAADTSADEVEAEHVLQEEASSPVKIYGFADFNYRYATMGKDSPWYLFVNRHPSFYVGNLNTYFDAQVAKKWRFLAEVRFTYLPSGASQSDPEAGAQTRVSASYQDYTDFVGRSRQVGGIMLERAQLEYRANDYLKITVGQWLSPYGIWVVDHGSPVIIGVFRPFIIGSQLIPERQVGLLGTGQIPINDDLDVSYALGLSNGRGDYTAFEDMDNNKAITARAAVSYRGFGELSIGATLYRGQDTTGTERLYLGSNNVERSRFIVSSRLNEATYAADLLWVKGGFRFQTEWLLHDVRYAEDGRPRNSSDLFYPDRRDWGAYGLIGYRTPWLGIMPYVKVERSPHPAALAMGIPSQFVIMTGGINVRAVHSVVFKLEYDYGFFTDSDAKKFSKSDQQYLNAQIACSF